jgi:hypothetical protein
MNGVYLSCLYVSTGAANVRLEAAYFVLLELGVDGEFLAELYDGYASHDFGERGNLG